jgi:hypothetical protein
LILWLVVPEAKTNSQKLEMRGDLINLKNIGESIREKIDKYEEKDKGWIKKIIFKTFNFFKKFFFGLSAVSKNIIYILGIIIGISLLITSVLSIFGITFGAGIMMFNVNSLSLELGFPIMKIFSSVSYYLLIGSIYIFAVMPMIFLLLLSLFLIKRKSIMRGLVVTILLGLWMLSIITAGIIAVDNYSNVRKMIEEYNDSQVVQVTNRFYDFKDFSDIKISGGFETEISYGKNFKIIANGRLQDLDKLRVKLLDNQLLVKQKWPNSFCLFCFFHPVKLEIILPELKSLDLSVANRTVINKFKLDDLNLNLSGASEISIKEIEAKNLSIKLSDASEMYLSGKTENIIIEGNNASELYAIDLSSDFATINLFDASSVDISVSKTLEVNLLDASSVQYKGEPKITSKISDSSEITKVDLSLED